MFLLYNILLTLLSPIWVPWMWFRARARKEPPHWAERIGDYDLPPAQGRPRVWFHAVSVGEVVAATTILEQLRAVLPTHEIVLSVTTSSGHRTAEEKGAGLFDHLVYFPIDVARFQLAAMQRVRPEVVAIMETELWMNFLWAAKVFDARTLLINGRISDRSFRRSRRVGFFYRALLAKMDRCLMQSEEDARRIRELGATNPEVFGNCKFDQALKGLDADPAHWRTELGLDPTRPVIVVGSIRAEEFSFLAEAIEAVGHGPQWVIAPRHLEKADDLAQTLGDTCARRSKGDKGSDRLILDSYGELDLVYAVADVAIVGGGFANLGGQNLLQPLAHGKPVLHGPSMQNFRDVAAMAERAGATRVCATPGELAGAVKQLLTDPATRAKMGAAAAELVRANAGASRRYAEAIAAEARKIETAPHRQRS